MKHSLVPFVFFCAGGLFLITGITALAGGRHTQAISGLAIGAALILLGLALKGRRQRVR
jgi:hypothetical protein